MMLTPGVAYSIDDLRDANKQAGRHWFDRDTMRAFSSRVSSTVYTGASRWWFVSSEKSPERVYSVRSMDTAGHVGVGAWFRGPSRDYALRVARLMALAEPAFIASRVMGTWVYGAYPVGSCGVMTGRGADFQPTFAAVRVALVDGERSAVVAVDRWGL